MKNISYEMFEMYLNDFKNHKEGIKIFYSPVKKSDLLILGFNAGGTDFYEKQEFENNTHHLKDNHEYLTENYPIAKVQRKILGTKLIENSVKTNLIFLRTKNIDDYNKLDRSLRNKLVNFSKKYIPKIITNTDPKLILIEGIATFDLFCKMFDVKQEKSIKNNNQRLMSFTKYMGINVIGIKHPSGSRISNNEIEQISKKVKELLK